MISRTFAALILVCGFCSAGSEAYAANHGLDDVTVDDAEKLTSEERDRYAQDAVAEIRDTYGEMQIIGTTRPDCVLNRLVMVGTLTKVTSESAAAMNAYSIHGDEEKATTELRKIIVAVSVARDYRNKARACSNADEGTDQATTADPEPRSDSDVLPPFELGFDVTADPPEASPFM